MALEMKTESKATMRSGVLNPSLRSGGAKAASHTMPKAKAKPIPQPLRFWKNETKKRQIDSANNPPMGDYGIEAVSSSMMMPALSTLTR